MIDENNIETYSDFELYCKVQLRDHDDKKKKYTSLVVMAMMIWAYKMGRRHAHNPVGGGS